ncbi:hypothetical protein [Mycobacterium sp. 4858]|uniref:hypothetical protein n=1 Tax=Mycobacterium sp. 4858 TaxID=2057185 RepID=UPI001E3838B3|nr:hypothetical protein [Mycobacterium sp. 4858]
MSVYLAVVVLTQPIGVKRWPRALEYQTAVHDSWVWAVLYIAAVIGPAVMSGYRSITVFASLWCIYAAVLSVLVLVHMRRCRRLPDPHRYQGVAMDHATSKV